jgi:hypothetical protein
MLRRFLPAWNGYRSAAMALLRRRKREEARGPQAPAAAPAPTADAWTPEQLRPAAPAGQTRGDEWVPAGADVAEREQSPSPPAEWLPEGVTARPRTRRPSKPRNAAPVIEGSATEPQPAPAPAPAAAESSEELRRRIDALEDRLAVAQREAVATPRADHGPTEAEAAASAELQMLRARLADFEKQLQHAPRPYNPPAVRAATAMRLAISIAVFVVIAGAPLFTTRRTTCHGNLKKQVSWSFVAPFDDSGPPHCKNELGGTVVLDALGLR